MFANSCPWNQSRTGLGLLVTETNPTGVFSLPHLPKDVQESDCATIRHGHHCGRSGDVRSSEQTGLTILHTMFHRNHNLIALQLFQMNPFWDDTRYVHVTCHLFPHPQPGSQTRYWRWRVKWFPGSDLLSRGREIIKCIETMIFFLFSAGVCPFHLVKLYCQNSKQKPQCPRYAKSIFVNSYKYWLFDQSWRVLFTM